ncbi:MAG: FAD-linked oxidase C-terminal domain-containing protein [Ktedonobacteraceae bacterium]
MLQVDALRSLKTLLPEGQVHTDRAALVTYESDAGLDRGIPEGVVFPRTPDEVTRVVCWAAEHSVPLVARGAGTGLSGGAVADRGGIVVEFSHMNRILDVDSYGRSAIAEPAVINLALDERVKAHGLYFPPDPASQRASTIGGNVAENAGGPHCFKYGVTTNYITGLHVVLADGSQIRVGGLAMDYPEYDLRGLITGSEGMLALMTAISVRLIRNPPGVKTLLVAFDSVEQAGVAVSAIIAAGLVPATMEMMDRKIIGAVEDFAHAGLSRQAGALLLIEVDGYPQSLDAQMGEIEQILRAHSGYDLRIAHNEEERARIWLARKSAAGALARLSSACYTVDITVPRSRLAEMLAQVDEICDRYGLRVGHVFHAGDGNLHPLILIPEPENPVMREAVHRASWELVRACIEMNGSLSGEHGVGIEKREFMSAMHTPAELLAMWDVKQAFDPQGILNPGKVFPPAKAGDLAPFAGYTARESIAVPVAGGGPQIGEVFTPATAEEAAQGLVALSHARRSVSISGAAVPGALPEGGVLLSTGALRGIKTYAADDLYITVGAGTPLAEIQDFLARDRRQVPLISPWPEATIGGLVSANVNAPLRMRYGAVRDLVLYATVALADGRVIRTGRPITKNVAGYDLTRVFIGAYGTLGLLADVTLRLLPQPRATRTLLIPVEDMRRGLLWARQLLPVALVASAIVLCRGCKRPAVPDSAYLLAYTAEGLPEDVQAELDQVRQALHSAGAPATLEVEAPSGSALWAEMLGSFPAEALHLRVGLPARDLPAYMQDQASVLNAGSFVADISSGLLYAAHTLEDAGAASAWVAGLRKPALAAEGYALAIHLPSRFQGQIERHGYRAQGWDVMTNLKARWDPASIMNPGLFI